MSLRERVVIVMSCPRDWNTQYLYANIFKKEEKNGWNVFLPLYREVGFENTLFSDYQ